MTTEVMDFDPDVKYLKVLVVDDIALNQLVMTTLLEEFGFGCDMATSAAETSRVIATPYP